MRDPSGRGFLAAIIVLFILLVIAYLYARYVWAKGKPYKYRIYANSYLCTPSSLATKSIEVASASVCACLLKFEPADMATTIRHPFDFAAYELENIPAATETSYPPFRHCDKNCFELQFNEMYNEEIMVDTTWGNDYGELQEQEAFAKWEYMMTVVETDISDDEMTVEYINKNSMWHKVMEGRTWLSKP